MPIILGPDGPSLRRLRLPRDASCRASSGRSGQLKPGDKVRFRALTAEEARIAATAQDAKSNRFCPPVAPALSSPR